MSGHKRFNEFAQEASPLDGGKMKIDDVLNKEILIIGFRLRNSQYSRENATQCLTLQFESDGQRYILFTGSIILTEQIEKYQNEIPFLTIIKKIDRFYTFS